MKCAVITGGAGGIGLAITKTLYEEGYCVAVIDMKEPMLDNLGIDSDKSLFFRGSIASKADRERFISETIEKFGRIDVLVNNAGITPAKRMDLLDMTEESFDRVISVNLKGCLGMSQIVAKQMIKQQQVNEQHGVIINISSCSAYASSVNRGEYCISKTGISMLTKLFADRLAAENIGVYEIRPGIIATDMTSTVKEKYDKLINDGLLPISRWGKPQDVANAVSVLCSGKLCYSTGEIINVDGGFHIQRL